MKNTAMIVVGLILAGILGIIIGFGASCRLAFGRNNFQVNRAPLYQFQPRMGMKNGSSRGLMQGQITKVENNNITLQLPNGSAYTFTIGDQTVVDKATKGAITDLQTGQNITVLGGSFINGAHFTFRV